MRGTVSNTIKVPYTPFGALKSVVQKTLSDLPEAPDKGTTKVVESGGSLITSGLSSHQMWGGQTGCHMSQDSCLISDEHDCRPSRSIYQIVCQNCGQDPTAKSSVYIGTSGRSLHSRQKEHQTSVRKKKQSHPLVKHHSNAPPGIDANFTTEVLHRSVRFNLDRFVTEALEIDRARDDPSVNLLNQKSEWGQQTLPRLRITPDD